MAAIVKTNAKAMKYFVVEPDLNSSFHSCWDLANIDRLQSGQRSVAPKVNWPDGLHSVTRGPWTIPDYLEAPHFVVKKRKGNPPSCDFGVMESFMFISARIKALFGELAPGACDYRRCTTEFSDGSPGPETWMGSVTRVFREAVDESKSNLRKDAIGNYMMIFPFKTRLMFRKEVIGDQPIFRLAEFATDFICNEPFKQACRAAGIRGMAFTLVGELA
jgi:hypothetical protein